VACTHTLSAYVPLKAGESITVSPATQVGETNIWYFAVSFNNAMIVPSENHAYKRVVKLNFAQTGGGAWDMANDPSATDITSTGYALAPHVPVYDTSYKPWKVLGGFEPGGAGYIQWRRAHYNNAMEDAGSVALIAERVGGSTGAVSTSVSLVDGTATAADDYSQPKNTTINWSDGEAGEKTISIPIVNDTIDERRHYFTASLAGFTGGAAAGITTSARVSIEDNDFGSTVAAAPTTTSKPRHKRFWSKRK
jgi:hypothetical protein